MFYKSVAEIIALFRRDDLPESHLHFFRLLDPVHKTDPVRQADTVGISDDRRLPEYIPHNKVCTLSSNARKL